MSCIDGYKPYKGRTIDIDSPVRIYRNLHRKCYSIQQNRLIVGHCESFLLKDFSFLVNEAGQRRVRKEGKKNVHAYITGYIVRDIMEGKLAVPQILTQGFPITYNPHKYDDFVYMRSEHVVNNEAYTYVYATINMVRVL